MAIFELDAKLLAGMFCAGVKELEANKDWINELNVFPVPDGDTGTNMTLTLVSAVNEVKNLKDVTLQALGKAVSSGSLRGARGNSGVILSQLCRGFTKVLKDAECLNGEVLVKALTAATETAYKAVMKPKEGTILTVARGISEKAAELEAQAKEAEQELELADTLQQLITYGDEVLANTPELLPVLKEAGVVDSGGQGLMVFIKGMYAVMTGEKSFDLEAEAAAEKAGAAAHGPKAVSAERTSYSVEFTIKGAGLTDEDETDLKTYLAGIGESVMVLSLNDTVKARVNTNDPGLALQRGIEYGTLSKIKIAALEEGVRKPASGAEEKKAEPAPAPEKAVQPAHVPEKAAKPAPAQRKQYGFVTVTTGAGLADIFKELGADGVIEGGQTMNPSAEDFVSEIEKINADIVYILPNNKNIIMAAELAQYMVTDKKVVVLPTKTIPQGISALIYFDLTLPEPENTESMKAGIANVRTGQITYAIRDTEIDGKTIHRNDIISVGDHSALLAVGRDTYGVARETVNALVSEEAGAISIYYGEGVSEEEAEKLGKQVEADYPNCDVEVQNGGQPIYYYIISVE